MSEKLDIEIAKIEKDKNTLVAELKKKISLEEQKAKNKILALKEKRAVISERGRIEAERRAEAAMKEAEAAKREAEEKARTIKILEARLAKSQSPSKPVEPKAAPKPKLVKKRTRSVSFDQKNPASDKGKEEMEEVDANHWMFGSEDSVSLYDRGMDDDESDPTPANNQASVGKIDPSVKYPPVKGSPETLKAFFQELVRGGGTFDAFSVVSKSNGWFHQNFGRIIDDVLVSLNKDGNDRGNTCYKRHGPNAFCDKMTYPKVESCKKFSGPCYLCGFCYQYVKRIYANGDNAEGIVVGDKCNASFESVMRFIHLVYRKMAKYQRGDLDKILEKLCEARNEMVSCHVHRVNGQDSARHNAKASAQKKKAKRQAESQAQENKQ